MTGPDTLERLRQFAEREVKEGAVLIRFEPGRGWSLMAEYGREAPDSPMAGAATYGMDDDPRACIEQGLDDAGYGVGMTEMADCPGCDIQLPADDLWGQKAHMEAHHPEIIEARLRAAGLEAPLEPMPPFPPPGDIGWKRWLEDSKEDRSTHITLPPEPPPDAEAGQRTARLIVDGRERAQEALRGTQKRRRSRWERFKLWLRDGDTESDRADRGE